MPCYPKETVTYVHQNKNNQTRTLPQWMLLCMLRYISWLYRHTIHVAIYDKMGEG